ncbi:NAD(P)-dependent oxidoreductase [Opitutus sp. ER46]|uniref:NAD-dependent epimerase/dehydratase family protein n=1 Tax=Opitutus sp. ER46 TaxID=2161864 RepID=UPI000D2FB969|nr:NAD(P)-dependent oxidoreductase [Opitutus sp. ER46]PTX92311.1 hypothetical protein DB354_13280 [Opitutus sp. ER46]
MACLRIHEGHDGERDGLQVTVNDPSEVRAPTIAITGAAGNLGDLLARHMLANTGAELRLLIHRRDVADDLGRHQRAKVFKCDLAQPESLGQALAGADTVVHFAGVLFKARPERFLPVTNTQYFRNLIEAAVQQRVRRVLLISFPHVEGETTPDRPATGRLDGKPESVHARTRLEEERMLFEAGQRHGFEAVSLRAGMVYGRGVLMIDTARWLAVWTEPTWIHLISKDDFVRATSNAAIQVGVSGIYHLGDEGKQTLQEFLDKCTVTWNTAKPWRLPLRLIYAAARLCEWQSTVLATASPLTCDFITIGRCSYYGDTRRMRAELLQHLKHPTLASGRWIL